MPLTEVPDTILSESLRDVDLIAAVAAPSKNEMNDDGRPQLAQLVREAAHLYGLANVLIEGNHIMVRGDRARYSIHLRSGTVMRLPATALHIDRPADVFIPHEDPDLLESYVLGCTRLLARDRDISDPALLLQITS